MTKGKCDEIRDHENTRTLRSLTLVTRHSSLVAVCLFLFVSGCGKKLSPVAPESVVPEPVKELRVLSRDSKLLINFAKPSKNIDGSKMTDLAGFKVMRRVVDEKGCKGCPEKFPVIYDIDLSYPIGAVIDGDSITFEDKNIESGVKYEYKVVPYNKDGYEGPEAPRAIFTWGVGPGKPKDFAGKAGDKVADISWSPPETLMDGTPLKEVAGYNIYRREEGRRQAAVPINSAPIKQTTFSDFGLVNDRTYCYTVRAMVRVNDSLLEGSSSDEIKVTPKETVIEELKGEDK